MPSHRAVTLRERYLAAARKRVEEVCARRKQVPYDDIWDAALAFPLVWESDVKDWVKEWKQAGRINLLGLAKGKTALKWEEEHVIEFLD